MSDIVEQIRSALAISDPDLDTSTGTTTRKIVDAVSEQIAEAYLDQHMMTYVYDVDSKSAADLDTFCQTIGGISRLAAKRASGTVTFIRPGTAKTNTATETIVIPVNTQVQTTTTPVVTASTIVSSAILPGEFTATVPVIAVDAGPSGNTAAGTLTQFASDIEGVDHCTNTDALTGGTDQETDAELRARWKKTAFRSMAGTEQMYLGQALDNPSVTAARVFGSSVTHLEQVQPYIPTSGTYSGKLIAQSVATGIAHVYQQGAMVGGSIADGILMTPGLDYTIDASSNPPVIVFSDVNATYDTGTSDSNGNEITGTVNGGILDFQYRYLPTVSRNDPDGTRFGKSSHVNRVDVIVSGQNSQTAVQSLPFSNKNVFSSSSADTYYASKFVRPDGTAPKVGNIFIPLSFGPILQLPTTLSLTSTSSDGKTQTTKVYGMMGASTPNATNANAFQIVHDASPFGYTADSRFGIEWDSSQLPANGLILTVGLNSTYVYNTTPGDVQAAVDRWRLLGTDVQTHAAQQILLRVTVAIMYNRGVDKTTVNTAIDQSVAALLSSGGMGGTLQVSDIEQAIHNVAGVDNVRLAIPSDYSGTISNYNTANVGVQRVVGGVVTKTYLTSSGRPTDITFPDNAAPAMESVVKLTRAQNTFTA